MNRRVCILRFDYYPQENHVRRNAAALQRAGYDVDIVCLRNPGQAPSEVVDGVTVHRVNLVRRRGNIARYLFEYAAFFVLAQRMLTSLHRRRSFAFVEVDSMPEVLVFAAAAVKRRGARVALYMFDHMPEIFSYDFGVPMTHPMIRFMKWVERRSVRFADRVIVTHTDAMEVLSRHGVPEDRFDIVLNVPDESVFAVPVHSGRDDDAFTIVSHGSQLRRYGYDTLVRAVASLGERIPELRVLMIGEGKDRPRLMALATELGVSHRFEFVTWVPFEEIPARVARCNLAVVPILLELALPNKLFEYSALEVPVIISDLHTLRDYYGDDAVRYVPPGDADALADAIASLHADRDARTRLTSRSRELYDSMFRWEKMKEAYLDVYRKLADGA